MALTKRTIVLVTNHCPSCYAVDTEKMPRFIALDIPTVVETLGGFGARTERPCNTCAARKRRIRRETVEMTVHDRFQAVCGEGEGCGLIESVPTLMDAFLIAQRHEPHGPQVVVFDRMAHYGHGQEWTVDGELISRRGVDQPARA